MKKVILSVLTVMTFVGTIASTQVANAQFPPPPHMRPDRPHRPTPQPPYYPPHNPSFPPQAPGRPNYPPQRPPNYPPPSHGRIEIFSYFAKGLDYAGRTGEALKEATRVAVATAHRDCKAYPGGTIITGSVRVIEPPYGTEHYKPYGKPQCVKASNGNMYCTAYVSYTCQYNRY